MTLLLDLRHALRALRRAPLLFLSATLSIALGVGATTAVFSWMDNLVLHPFPGIRDTGRIVGVETAFPTGDGGPTSFPTFREWRDASRSFSGMAAWSLSRVSARRRGESASTSLIGILTSGNYFDVLGGTAIVGRTLRPDDERARSPVAVLGYEAWRRELDADRSAVGRVIYLNGQAFTVVGVAAPKFVGTYLGVVPDLFVPITLQPVLSGINALDDRTARGYQIVARLARGVTRADAQRELDALARRLSEGYGDRPVLGAEVMDARLQFLGGLVFPLFAATLVVTALLLLVACANVAGLLLVRSSARASELSLRLALGASTPQIGRLLLLESAILGAAGSALGVSMAYLARGVLYVLVPITTFPITLSIDINGRVLLFAAAAAFVVTVLCGMIPALRSRHTPPGAALRAASPTLAPAASRLRFGIVAGQLAFSLMCLVTAGFFLRSLHAASTVDIGFSEPGKVLLVNTDLAAARFTGARGSEAIRELLRRTRDIPGVQHASVASFVPLGFGGRRMTTVRVDGYVPAPDEDMSVLRIQAGSDYAGTMRIAIVEGRDFTDADRHDMERVAVVNAAFARRFWRDASALGRRIDAGQGWATIVGVLRDGKYGRLAESPQPVAYVSIEQLPQPTFTLHVRASGDPHAVVEQVRGVLRAIHVDLPALQPRTLEDHISASTFIPRVGASVLSIFGGVALLLAIVGLHAAIAFAVALRTRELGIRIALGAGARAIVGAVVYPAIRIVLVGFAAGAALSLVMGQMLRAKLALTNVGPADPIVLLGGVAILFVAAIAAAWLPAVRALRMNPVTALRDG